MNDMITTPITKYIKAAQLVNMKVGDEIIFTTIMGTKFRIRKTNESEKCFSFYCLTTKCSICARCKANYILSRSVY